MKKVELSDIQIEFLAKCITMAGCESFYDIKADTITFAMNEFGFNEDEIEEIRSGYFLADVMVEKKLITFFSK